MLETELNDRENSSESTGGTGAAGVPRAGIEAPAGNGPRARAKQSASPEGGATQSAGPEGGAKQSAGSESGAAAPAARKATGRTRRAVTRAAGPPAAEPAPSAEPARSAEPASASAGRRAAVPPALAPATPGSVNPPPAPLV